MTINIEDALRHLEGADRRFSKLIKKYGEPDFAPQSNYFKSLVRSIIYQQLSGKSAFAIYSRFLKLFPVNDFPSPSKLLQISKQTYRSIGLSKQKSIYIKEIAKAFESKTVQPDKFKEMTNGQIRSELIKIKGIGPWTIDMFLMFTLNRLDILPTGDLGIQKGYMVFYDIDFLPDKDYMIKSAEIWRPFRTFACWYLWKLVDDDFQW
ncbi:MAG: DNA-3-methyladenine glycosylase [Candidatus Marinimicrobia bacterium]|nr:DNA-3-methyladenine glycosylase [Candidatus Neomarinimicrobiota bacterium]